MAQKKIESGDFVIPGDELGVEEEFMPGDNAFVDGGVVYSAATGKVQFDDKSRKVSVRPTTKLPPVPLDGEIVLAKVSYMRGQFARMEIFAIEGEAGRQIPSAPEGAVHISQAKHSYVKDLESEFQLGDIVRAKVINQDRDPIMLTTATTVGGLLPLALFGGVLFEPMAWAMIVGLTLVTIFTLIVIPVFYDLLMPKNDAPNPEATA